MVDELSQVPPELYAGDSFAWIRTLTGYPASTWALTYYFRNGTDSFNVVASAVGDIHSISVSGSDTGDYKAGRYRWHARVSDGSTVTTVEDGWLQVKPDPTKSNTDWRSHARKMLDAIELALEGQATKQQLDLISYTIGGTVNVNRDRELLMKWRDKYARELLTEDGGAGTDDRHRYIRFVQP